MASMADAVASTRSRSHRRTSTGWHPQQQRFNKAINKIEGENKGAHETRRKERRENKGGKKKEHRGHWKISFLCQKEENKKQQVRHAAM